MGGGGRESRRAGLTAGRDRPQFEGEEMASEVGSSGREWALQEMYPKGTRVRYIPNHARGDRSHPDCEDGIVSSTNSMYVFVCYGGRQNAIATDPEDLVRL